ncbi:MAG TPA: right-handed parallel beta-helix repeat-containing protein [Ramlibacter sp.]
MPPIVAAQPASPAEVVRLADHGAVCDGVTDDSRAIGRALARGKELRAPVLVPVGTCAYADILRVDGVTLRGAGERSVLHALDWRRSAIFMSGTSPVVADLKLTGVTAPERQAPWEMTRITVFGATGFAIEHVVIDGAAAAGIQTAQGATQGRITGNVVRNTLSDGIHLTGGASHLLVEGNLVEGTGDDGIAVVTYRRDAARVHHITARNNVVRRIRFGRNMSVVGGEHVLYENNLLQDNLAGLACLYIAQEGGQLPTMASRHVTASHNTLENCGGALTSHGALMLFSDGQEANADILLQGNDVRRPRSAGIRVRGPHVDVRLQSNRIAGALQPLDIRDPSIQVTPFTGGPVGYAGP